MRNVMRLTASGICAFVAACATAALPGVGDDQPVVDASTRGPDDGAPIDSRVAAIDAPATAIDAATSPIDAPSIDAAACTPTTTQRLINPAFDMTPMGASWVENLATAGDPPLITDLDGVP